MSTGGLGVYPAHTLFSCSCQVGPPAKGRLVPLGNSRGSVEAPISPSYNKFVKSGCGCSSFKLRLHEHLMWMKMSRVTIMCR